MSRPTLGAVRSLGYLIWAHCDRSGCGYGAELDLEGLIERYGPDVEAVALNGAAGLPAMRLAGRPDHDRPGVAAREMNGAGEAVRLPRSV